MSLRYTNPDKHSSHANSPGEALDWTMTNLDEITKTLRDGIEPDEFKAVCLSGIQDQDANSTEEKGYMEIIVRPIGQSKLSSNTLPDPREFKNAMLINSIIALHGAVFKAKSNFDYKDHSAIKFGQVVVCKWHRNSPPSDLRFDEPQGITLVKEYQDLAAIEGVAAGSLFTPPGQWPAGMQAIINGVTAMGAQLMSYLSGEGGGGPGGIPGAGAAFEGGNNAEEPSKNGVSPDECTQRGLLWPTHGKKSKQPTHIIVHCTAGKSNWEGTLGRQNKKITPKVKGHRLGYHFLISRTGEFTQCAHPALKTWHAGGNTSLEWYGYKLGSPGASVGVSVCNYAGEPGRKSDKRKHYPISGPHPGEGYIKAAGHAGYIKSIPLKFNKNTKKMEVQDGKGGVGKREPKWTEMYPKAQYDRAVDVCAILCLEYGIDPEKIYQHQAVVAKGDPGASFVPWEWQGTPGGDQLQYDPDLTEFKSRIRKQMVALKGKEYKDVKGRSIAGYMAAPEAPTPEEGAAPNTPSTDPNAPLDNNGKPIEGGTPPPETPKPEEKDDGGWFF